MIQYILVFIMVILLGIVYEKISSNIYKKILLVFIILLLSILGGLRALNIGTDVSIYGKSFFDKAENSDSLKKLDNTLNIEFGYTFLLYIVTRFTNNLNVFLFILQLITNSLVILTLNKYSRKENKFSFAIGILVYICIYYCRTYNFLRQSIALSIVLWGYSYIDEKKYKSFVVCVLIASIFHTTTLIAISLLPLKLLVGKKKSPIIYGAIYIILIGISIDLVDVIIILKKIGILSDRYYNYIYNYINPKYRFDWVDIIYKLIWLGSFVYMSRKSKDFKENNSYYFNLLILDLIFFSFRRTILYADRVALYFGYSQMIYVPRLYKYLVSAKKSDKRINLLVTSIFVVANAFFWYHKFVVQKSCEVYPYVSIFSNIG